MEQAAASIGDLRVLSQGRGVRSGQGFEPFDHGQERHRRGDGDVQRARVAVVVAGASCVERIDQPRGGEAEDRPEWQAGEHPGDADVVRPHRCWLTVDRVCQGLRGWVDGQD
jgi:hypothetical protein